MIRNTPPALAPLVSAALLALAGCGESSTRASSADEGPAWSRINEARLSGSQRAQRAEAIEARDALFRSLLAELTHAAERGGTADAIEVCAERAPAIAREVGHEHGVHIGRTSFRLRNPDNRPPAWAGDAIGERWTEPVYLASSDGSLGAVLPITVAQTCLSCHGQPESIAPAVRLRLSELYPDDRATGFTEGDLRGWFWVEVPPGG